MEIAINVSVENKSQSKQGKEPNKGKKKIPNLSSMRPLFFVCAREYVRASCMYTSTRATHFPLK